MPVTILVIEDNADIRSNTAEILEMANYKVLTAANGKEGVQLAMEQRPDLVICDITMPVLDGYGVLHLLHKHEDMSGIPFIFLTARAERAEVRKGMEMGADDYITKPFDPIELLNAIEGRLKKASRLKVELTKDMNGLSTLLHSVNGKDLLEDLKEGRNVNRYKKKEVIYSEGNHPAYLYFILKGKVKTCKRNDDGKEIITGLYNEKEFLGYTALLQSGTYKENAEALEETELAVIPREDFEELAFNSIDVMKKFIHLLARNIADSERQLLSVAYNSLRKKVADALLFLNTKYNSGNNPQFSIDISRDNLAAVAGVAKESLIRTLGDFRDEKLIDIREGEIVITDLKKLSRMMN